MLLNCLELISLIYQQFPVKPQTVGIEGYLGTGLALLHESTMRTRPSRNNCSIQPTGYEFDCPSASILLRMLHPICVSLSCESFRLA